MKLTFKVTYVTGWNGANPKKKSEQVTIEAANIFKAEDQIVRWYEGSEFGNVNYKLIKKSRVCKSCKIIDRAIHIDRKSEEQIKELCAGCKTFVDAELSLCHSK